MAVYKVIQDIEAEDKLLGPLTFKGLIYAGIAVIFGFVNFRLATSGIPVFIKLPAVITFALPMLLFGVLASPLGRDQPTEVWLLSRLKFFLKPRQRVWNQSGIVELVTVTAPKRIEKQLTKGYSQVEVQSRLKALANTLDSRGWIVKNINVNLSAHPDYAVSSEQDSDRLVMASSLTREVPDIDIHANDDIMDAQNNPTAQKFQTMMAEAEQKRKRDLAKKMEEARLQAEVREAEVPSKAELTVIKPNQPNPQPEPASSPTMGTTIITPDKVVPIHTDQKDETPSSQEQEFLDKLHAEQAKISSVTDGPPLIVPIHGGKVINPPNTMTAGPQAVKLELAQSGNDFSVATVAELANRKKQS